MLRAWLFPGPGPLPAKDKPIPRGELHLLLPGSEGSSSGHPATGLSQRPSETPSSALLPSLALAVLGFSPSSSAYHRLADSTCLHCFLSRTDV